MIKLLTRHFSTQLNPKFQPIYMQIAQKFENRENICKIEQHETIDYKLIRKPDSILCKYWWSESPFDEKQDLKIPVLSFRKQGFNQEYIFLEQILFNQPIRRDLIHRVNHWSLMWEKKTFHRTKKPYDVDGSGKKIQQQKKTGKARKGAKRSGLRRGGGKNWGHIPKLFTQLLPVKMKIKGLQAILSAKLAEGKIIIYDQEDIAEQDPVKLSQSLLSKGQNEKYIFVQPEHPNQKFAKTIQLVKNYKAVNPNQVNVRDLLTHDKLIFTKKSLKEFTELLLAYIFYLNKPKAIQNEIVNNILKFDIDQIQPDQGNMVYDPEVGFEPKFQVLQDYYKYYQKLREENQLEDYYQENEKYNQF